MRYHPRARTHQRADALAPWSSVPRAIGEFVHIGYGVIGSPARALAAAVLAGTMPWPEPAHEGRLLPARRPGRGASHGLHHGPWRRCEQESTRLACGDLGADEPTSREGKGGDDYATDRAGSLGLFCRGLVTRLLAISADLGIADDLADGAKSAGELARAVGADPGALHRILRALASDGIFAEETPGVYRNTEASEGLRRGPRWHDFAHLLAGYGTARWASSQPQVSRPSTGSTALTSGAGSGGITRSARRSIGRCRVAGSGRSTRLPARSGVETRSSWTSAAATVPC